MTDPLRTTVLLIDDHQIILDGLKKLLEEDGGFTVVGEAHHQEEALEMMERLRPEVVVMDVLMGDRAGLETCRNITDQYPDTRVLVLTTSTDEDLAIDAVAAGARGYLQKYTGINELLESTRAVAEGRYRIPDEMLTRIFQTVRRHTYHTSEIQRSHLSDREQEMLTLFALGNTYDQIATARGISPHTVRNTIYSIQDKLGVKSRQQLTLWAVRNGMLDTHTAGPGAQPV